MVALERRRWRGIALAVALAGALLSPAAAVAAPVPTIDAPAADIHPAAGDAIAAAGSASDADPGGGDIALHWDLLAKPCAAGSICALDELQPADGATATFTTPGGRAPLELVLRLTATDANGSASTEEVIDPATTTVTLASDPAGYVLEADGAPAPDPFSVVSGTSVDLHAPAEGGVAFAGWTDGVLSADRTLAPTADATYTARYRAPPSISGTPHVGDTLTAVDDSWAGDATNPRRSWQSCDGGTCTEVGTDATYTATASDVGHTIALVETADDRPPITSPAVGPVKTDVAAKIDPPGPGPWSAGQAIPVTGSGTGTLGQALAGDALTWQLIARDCSTCADQVLATQTGSSPTFTAPQGRAPAALLVRLTASDDSQSATAEAPLALAVAQLTVASDPAGHPVSLDGDPASGPVAFVAGSAVQLSAPPSDGGVAFAGWADGVLTADRTVAPTADTTYTARYRTPPSISGTPHVGDTLTAVDGDWTRDAANLRRSWQSCDGGTCTEVGTDATYTPTASDVGHTIALVETAEDRPQIESAPVGPVTTGVAAAISPPGPGPWSAGQQIALRGGGTGRLGQALPDNALTWQLIARDCSNCADRVLGTQTGSSATFTAPHGRAPAALLVRLTATDGSESATDSAPLKLAVATLSASSQPAGHPVSLDGTPGAGAIAFVTGSVVSLSAPASDAGARFAGWTDGATAPSRTVTALANAAYVARYLYPPTVLEAPAVVGVAKAGTALQASDGRFGGDAPQVSRAWQRCDAPAGPCVDLPATGTTYVPGTADVGRYVRLRVTAANAVGTVTAFSPAVGPVAPAAVPKPSLQLLIALVRAPRLSGHRLVVTIRCLPRGCRAKVGGRLLVAHRRKPVRLPTVSTSVARGRDRTLRLKVPDRGLNAVRDALRRHRKVLVRLTGSATDAAGHRATFLSTTRL